MERLIESILNISIKDEKDMDRSQVSDSCANSMMGYSQYGGNINMTKISEEIELSMNVSMRDIPKDERQNIWKPKFFKMYLEGVSNGVG